MHINRHSQNAGQGHYKLQPKFSHCASLTRSPALAGLLLHLLFPIFMSSCGFGFIRTRAPIRRLVFSRSLRGFDMTNSVMAKYGFDWAGDYYDSVRDHIHALGVVAATYNRLEFTFFMLFLHYYRHRDKAASFWSVQK